MRILSNKITPNLAINELELDSQIKTANFIQKGRNIIFACDVSGSMSSSLPKMRQQLKNRIPDLVSENDTISIIWFSGKNEAGILKEGVKVKNLTDLQGLNNAIDRFLVPICLTAFLPPIELTNKVISNLKDNGNDFSFIFLSDGYNNDSSWPDVINELSKLEDKISNATFIEYGYYADSSALTEMAETIGGEKIFSSDFDSYQENFEKIIQRKSLSKKKQVDISNLKSRLTYQFFFTYNEQDQSINVYSCKNKDFILVPEDVNNIYFLTQYKPKESDEMIFLNSTLLIAAYLLADRMKYKHVEDILISIGDVELINKFSGAYGKQKLNELKDSLKEFAFNNNLLFKEGRVESYKIDPKQYCVMDLINDLQEGDNKFYPYHELFNYNRIGSKKVTKVQLDEEAQQALLKAKTLKEVESITSSIEFPEFIYPENAHNIGMSFKDLVWNSERANLSILTKLNGKVKLPKNEFGLSEVNSFIYRTYTFIKDGILNVTEIPVVLDKKTFEKLNSKGLIKYSLNDVYLLDISSLPIINRSMISNISGKKLANLEFDLIKVQLGHKYLKNIKDQFDPKENKEFAEQYSKEAAEWLKSIGVSNSNGFSPKTEVEKSGDFYLSPVLNTKIEKTSNQPKVEDVLNKIDSLFFKKDPKAKPLNLMENIMKSEIDELNNKAEIDLNNKTLDINELNNLTELYNKERRKLLFEISKIKFSIILSRTWFTEFENMEQNVLEKFKFKSIDNELDVKFEFKEKQIQI